MSNLEHSLQPLIAARDWCRLVSRLERESKAHAGTPPAKVKSQVAQLIETGVPASDLAECVRQLASAGSSLGKELALELIPRIYERDAGWVNKAIWLLAEDADWEVREYAASAVGALLQKSFRKFYPSCDAVADSGSVNQRRAVAVGVKYSSRDKTPGRCPAYLRLVGKMMHVRDIYLRKNLGPFALGDGLLRTCPTETLKQLDTWSRASDEVVLWNVAAAFGSAEASKHALRAFQILGRLADDSRKLVRMRLTATLKRLGSRNRSAAMAYLKGPESTPSMRRLLREALSA